MKKYALIIMVLAMFLAAACGRKKNTQESDNSEVKTMINTESSTTGNTEDSKAENKGGSTAENVTKEAETSEQVSTEQVSSQPAAKENEITENKIRIATPDGDIIVVLEDNSASADLLKRLPMTVHFEDFNNTEKISYIDGKLDTSNAVTEYTPLAGAFAYYIPWGNLSVFYEDFRQSSGLASLGTVESGMEYVKTMDKYDSVTIERLGD